MNWHVFETRDAMVRALKASTITALSTALAEKGQASWVVSGGSTPKPLFDAMSTESLDWSNIQVALVDERWVDPGHPRSNEDFMKGALDKNLSAAATFIGMKTPHESPWEAVEAENERYGALSAPFDSVLLGMGSDGHTASFFPDAKGLEEALDPNNADLCCALTAHKSDVTGEEVDRMSITASAIIAAKHVVLMITGDEKKRVLEEALEPSSSLPVGRLARLSPFDIYWAP
jgi:6-phosphogluconolactonase